MGHIRQVGRHLYACGNGGQVYKRDDAEFGKGKWSQLAPELLQDPSVVNQERLGIYFCVNGPHEREIYVCGTEGTILCWDGEQMHKVESGTDVSLIDILVADPNDVYICGRKGTLLRGNWRDGFLHVQRGAGGTEHFTSMAMCGGKLYVGSNSGPRGLFVLEKHGLEQVWCGLTPEITDVNIIDSAEDVLWVVGSKDLLRFEGKRWERIEDPDNEPIGGPPRPPSGTYMPPAISNPGDPIERAKTTPGFPDAIVARINCFGMGDWLAELFNWLEIPLPEISSESRNTITMESVKREIKFRVYRVRESAVPSWDNWVLSVAMFGKTGPLPLCLDRGKETPQSASARLLGQGTRSRNVDRVTGGHFVSYFLSNGTVVEIAFGKSDVGISGMQVIGLGAPSDWRQRFKGFS